MMKGRSSEKHEVSLTESNSTSSFHGRFLWFFWFLLLGSALTWIPLNGFVQVGLVLGGLGVPLYYAWRKPLNSAPLPWKDEILSPLPSWCWIAFIALALALRLFAIQTLPAWPNSDEGGIGTIGLQISQNLTSRFFYSFAQTPPLAFWLNALAVKCGLNPFLCLWLPPALFSVLTLGLGYFSVRKLTNPSFAFVFSLLLAFTFWPLYMGRHAHEGSYLPLFEFLVVLGLAWFISIGGKESSLRAFFLGLTAGLGFWTFTSWASVALLMFFFGVWSFWKNADSRKHHLWFFPGLLLGCFPFLWAVWKEGYGQHLSSLTPWSGWFPWAHQVGVDWHYLTVLFWGAFDKESAYTPVEGGFLNPLLGAFFFLGLIQIIQRRKESWAGWTLISFPILLLPGLLSMNVEAFRIVQILLPLLFITTLGITEILGTLSLSRRWLYLGFLILVTASFDLYRMMDPWLNAESRPGDFDRPVKSVEKYRAYSILEQTWKDRGPGFILADFDPEAQNDATLSLLTRLFSNEWGTIKSLRNYKWASLFINVHYQPYLEKSLPGTDWFFLEKGVQKPDGGMVLAIIPLDRVNPDFLDPWIRLNDLMREVDADRLYQPHENWDVLLSGLSQGEALIKGNPFLASVYWDKVAAFEYGKVDYAAHLAALQHAVKEGYPTAALCFELGNLYLTKGFRAEAIQAYEKAIQAPLDLTPSRLILKQLGQATPKP